MKRILSSVLVMLLLFTATVPAVGEGTQLSINYAPVEFLLFNLDDIQMEEMAFREWAYEKLNRYYDEYLGRKPFKLHDEYYKLATYTDFFGRMFGKEVNDFGITKREIEYTKETMTEEQMDQLYLELMLNTLSEMKKTQPNYMEKYLSLSKKERRVYTLSVGGEWEENEYLAEVDAKSKEDMVNELANCAADIGDLLISTGITYAAPDCSDIASSVTKIATEAVKTLAERATENAKAKAENSIKRYLTQRIVNTMMDAKAADVACMKEVYLSGNCTDERAVSTAQKLVAYYESEAVKNNLITEGEALADKHIKEVMDSFGMELKAELEGSEIMIMTVMDVVRSSLSEVLDAYTKNVQKEAPGTLNAGFTQTFIDLFNKLIESVCNNIQEDWIETGAFHFDKGFIFDKEDWNGFFKESNIFDILTDTGTLENARESMKAKTIDHVKTMQVGLGGRVLYVLAYYMVLELPEGAIDDLIDRTTKENYKEEMVNSLFNNLLPLLKDECAVIGDYLKDSIAVAHSEQQNELTKMRKENKAAGKNVTQKQQEELNKSVEGRVESLEKVADDIECVEMVLDLAEKAWNVGSDIAKAYTETADSLKGEDGINYLAQGTVMAKKLSYSLKLDLLGGRTQYYLAMDEDKITIAELWSYVAKMWEMAAVDVCGSTSYYNVDLAGRDTRKNTDFMKLLNGKEIFRYSILHFQSETIEYDYQNVYGTVGLLELEDANNMRNNIADWKDWVHEGWKDEWLLLRGVSQYEETDIYTDMKEKGE